MFKRILFKQVLIALLVVTMASCASQNAKQDIACTKKILSVIELSNNATTAYDQGDLELAEKLFKQVVATDPDNVRAWYKLGNIYFNTDRPKAAIDAYHNVIELDPNHTMAKHNLGIVYLEQSQKYLHQSRDSEAVFEEVITKELKKYLQQMLEQM